MAEKWYPVIDYAICLECGTCVAQCPHQVYDLAKAPAPVVRHPESCVDHCHGCGNRCPAGAITYVGDDTGWTPPQGEPPAAEPAVAESRAGLSGKSILIEYLYLDLNTCSRCIGTDQTLDEVVRALAPALKLAGYDIDYRKIEVKSAELAIRHRFLSSPTIRVNGQDICRTVQENQCGCCSEISGSDVECRVFAYNGQMYEVPPQEMLAVEILSRVFGPSEEPPAGSYQLPDNLQAFFAGKKSQSACNCGGTCC